MVDNAVIRPEVVEDLVYRFAIPPGAGNISIASRSMRPSENIIGASDHRRLGVAIDRIAIREGEMVLEARHTHPVLKHGFHDDEGTHRWTNGRARIPADWLQCFAGALILDLANFATASAVRVTPAAATA